MTLLEVEVVRASGSSLGGSREPIFFELSMEPAPSQRQQQPSAQRLVKRTASTPSPSSQTGATTALQDLSASPSTALLRTRSRKRGYMWARSGPDVKLEFNEKFAVPVHDVALCFLVVACVKGSAAVGQTQVAMQGLPKHRHVQKWFQLHDRQRRNVDALVFLRLRLIEGAVKHSPHHVPLSGASAQNSNVSRTSPNQPEKVRPSMLLSGNASATISRMVGVSQPPANATSFNPYTKAAAASAAASAAADATESRTNRARTLRERLISPNPFMPRAVEPSEQQQQHNDDNDDDDVSVDDDDVDVPQGLVDYFLVVGFKDDDIANVYRHWKEAHAQSSTRSPSPFPDRSPSRELSSSLSPRSRSRSLSRSPSAREAAADMTEPFKVRGCILAHFPEKPLAAIEVPAMVPLVCFPDGVSCTDVYRPPSCFSFYLSSANTYGSVLVFWTALENASAPASPRIIVSPAASSSSKAKSRFGSISPVSDGERSSPLPSDHTTPPPMLDTAPRLFVPTAFVLTSRSPFCPTFCQFLSYIYTEFVSPSSSSRPDGLTLEKCVASLLSGVHMPVHGGPSLRLSNFLGVTDTLSLPAHRYLPKVLPYSLIFFFRLLDIDTVLSVISCLLTGRSVLVHSSQASLLMPVCECLLSLLMPLRWVGIYIPLLPSEALPVLESPVPFFVGMTTSLLQQRECRSDMFTLDIDLGQLHSSAPLPLLPTKIAKNLRKRVRKLTMPNVFAADSRSLQTSPPPLLEQESFTIVDANKVVESSIRDEFLRYIAALLLGYRAFVSFDTSDTPHFDAASFLEQRTDARPFLSRFIGTQAFLQFIDHHVFEPSLLADVVAYSLTPRRFASTPNGENVPLMLPSDLPDAMTNDATSFAASGIGWRGLDLAHMRQCLKAVTAAAAGASTRNPLPFASLQLSSFDCKHRLELQHLDSGTDRVSECMTNLLRDVDVEVGELCSVMQLCRGHERWRAAVTNALSFLPTQKTLRLRSSGFDKLACVALACLEGTYVQKDLACARHLLGHSVQIYTVVEHEQREYLRDAIKGAKIWHVQSFWTYLFSIELLSRPGVLRQSSPDALEAPLLRISRTSSMPNPDYSLGEFLSSKDDDDDDTNLTRTASGTLLAADLDALLRMVPKPSGKQAHSAWPDFVFGSICSILCTLQALGIAEKTATMFSMNLALSQGLDQKQCGDLLTLIKNVYRTPFDTESSSSPAPSRNSPLTPAPKEFAFSSVRESNALVSAKRRARFRIARTKSF